MVKEDIKIKNSNDEAILLEKVITGIEQKNIGWKVIWSITQMMGNTFWENNLK